MTILPLLQQKYAEGKLAVLLDTSQRICDAARLTEDFHHYPQWNINLAFLTAQEYAQWAARQEEHA